MNKLSIVTTTNRIDGWFDYCKHIKHLQDVYGNKFDVVILDNSNEHTFEIKKGMLLSHLGDGKKTVKMMHFDTFVECRNQQRFQVETPFMTILDDDDQICDGFLSIFNFLLDLLTSVDYINLSKIKYGMQDFSTGYAVKSLSSPTNKLHNFNDYDNYSEDRLTKVYPINGYCILSTDLYKEFGETIQHYVDDCYPMMKCFINCKFGYKVSLPWQFYKTQNNFMFDTKGLENCDKSFAIQIEKLWEEYHEQYGKLILKQLMNVKKSLSLYKNFNPRMLNELYYKLNNDRT